MAATPAGSILEINDVVANLAAKQFHGKQSSPVSSARNVRGVKSFPLFDSRSGLEVA
jgi:hypothetical protein